MSRGGTLTLVGSTSVRRRPRQSQVKLAPVVRLGRGPMTNEAIQGHECGAYVALGRFAVTEHGMAYGARALRLRSPHSSRGSHVPPGQTREASTGRRGTGDSIPSHREVREMRTAATILSIMRGRYDGPALSPKSHWRAD